MEKKIDIQIRCFATLGKYAPADNRLQLEPGSTVRDLVHRLDIPESEVKIIFIHGEQATWESRLSDQDRVGLFPAVGGG
jgi:molybdopterin converting factor small subunit